MTKLLLILIGLLAINLTFGQKEIWNTKTDKHKQITGTKIFLIPPAGFINATNFSGFQQMNSGACIFVIELSGPLSQLTKGFDKQGLKNQGIILKKREEINVNGYQGLYLKTEQLAHGTNYSKYILVFGDDTSTYMVSGIFPKEVKELDKDIVESMLSIVFEPRLFTDPLNAVSFSIDTDSTKLKFANGMSGILFYTVDGKIPPESHEKTFFSVGLSLADDQTIDKKLTAINRIKKVPYIELKIDENKIDEIEIDGISGYEIVGEGIDNSNGTKERVYQVMLFSDNGYYIMLGTTNCDFETNLNMFRKVARTFKRK